MNRTQRAMMQLCRDVIVLDSDEERDGRVPSLGVMAGQAKQILAALAPRRSSKPRASRPARVEKATTKATRRERRADLRAQAMERDGGRCVLATAPLACPNDLEMHHLAGRHRESIHTVAMLCGRHHALAHGGDVETLSRLAIVAATRGWWTALEALDARIAKIEEARRSRQERGTGG